MIYAIRYTYYFLIIGSMINPIWEIEIYLADVPFMVLKDSLIMPTSRAYSDLTKPHPADTT
jgi:hypothetical protein